MEGLDWSAESQLNTSGVTLNADLEPELHHQIPMTCTYGYSHFIHFKTAATEVDIQFLSTLISLLPQFGSAFSLLKKGMFQYFCPYKECTSHWCLVIHFWLKVCIKSHTRGVQLLNEIVGFAVGYGR